MPSAFPNERVPKKSRKKTVPASLKRMYERALTCTDEEVYRYQPTELVVKICEAYLQGHISHADIADFVNVESQTVSSALREPVVSAWVAKSMNSIVRQRLGLIDAAMLSRALSGDVSAAKLLYERHGKIVKRSMHVSLDGTDYTQFTTEDLQKIIAAKQAASEVVDV